MSVTDSMTLAISRARLPWAGWRATIDLPGADVSVVWPEGRLGVMTVAVALGTETTLANVARAVIRAIRPGYGPADAVSAQLTVSPYAPVSALGMLATPWADPPYEEPLPDVLLGSDVVATGEEDEARWQAAATVVLPTDGGGALRSPQPTIDIHLHHPVNRRAPRNGDPKALRAGLHADGEGWRISAASGAAVLLRPGEPISADNLHALRKVESISLTDVRADSPHLPARLVELAASGLILHDGDHLAGALPGVDPVLVSSFAGRLPELAAERTIRGATQRRQALRAHNGVVIPRIVDGEARLVPVADSVPHVTVLLTTNRPHLVVSALRQIAAQTYPSLDVVVVLHGTGPLALTDDEDAELGHLLTNVVEVPASETFGEALAEGTRRASGPLLTKIDDDDLYGPEHVWDLVLARMYSGATVVGKQAEFVYLEAQDTTIQRKFRSEYYSEQVAGGTLLISLADLYSVGGWRPVPRAVDRALFQRVLREGGLTYVTHPTGFMYVRHGRGHTWVKDDEHFLPLAMHHWPGIYREALGERAAS
ncbi:Glycosyltransferase involved in cell wall bisynthesis [Flavimobilis marinus]|uniref:Glycosyltransferase involved in cell wall bisynthesis n=1 Tax=Flavimobilis marinus TaxID=285351 RepID=A0A1I2GM97_9MICO|nr:Glycosyltransferase involved in cell wall bisynthesis [Flavimobilis marinus]